MRKPEASKKRRLAAAKRALKRNKRNTNGFKKTLSKKLLEKHRAKIAAEKKFKQHLSDLMGKQQ
jgi:light-regulated signal transduction histidine kinase (bacteriophytochrome)